MKNSIINFVIFCMVFSAGTCTATITGTLTLCSGSSTTLTCSPGGGTWTSSNSSAATISAGGVVNAISGGSTTISYTVGGTTQTATFTVNQSPDAISGPSSVCNGLTISMTESISGGTWTSSNTGLATVSTTGVVTGLYPTTGLTITYTMPGSCKVTYPVTVLNQPAALTGSSSVCQNSTIILSDATTYGTWASSNTSASVSADGDDEVIVTGNTAGSANITYTLSDGCYSVKPVTILAIPATISGALYVCTGASVTLTDGTSGGVWTSQNTTIATVNTSGEVTGIASSSDVNITYTASNGCSAIHTMSVVQSPGTINPYAPTTSLTVCEGAVISVQVNWDNVIPFTYSTSDNSIATVTPGTGGTSGLGYVTGMSGGTVILTFTSNPSGCFSTAVVTVDPLPSVDAISGASPICDGSSTTYTDGTTGGEWNSSNTSIATVGSSTGIVTGVSGGTATISYKVTNSCGNTIETQIISVETSPSAGTVTGASSICSGNSTTLSDGAAGGSWSSSNTSVATASPSSGVVLGISGGSTTVSYTVTNSCGSAYATIVLSVNPGNISGNLSVCVGGVTTLTDAGGGTWTSSNSGIAAVDGSGNVTGVSPGIVLIDYTLGTGCSTNVSVTVNATPDPISGTLYTCAGSVTVLNDDISGGTWTSSASGVATVDASGNVTGVTAGTATIVYTLSTGCSASVTVTINTSPGSITGTLSLCVGTTTTLSDEGGGSWTTSNSGIASVDAYGVVTGVSAGTATIIYTYPAGCSASVIVTVYAVPDAGTITGEPNTSVGTSITLIDATTGGSWSSSNTAIGTIVSTTGVLTGISQGTATVSYTVSNSGCSTIATTTIIVTEAISCNPASTCLVPYITTMAGNGIAGSSGDGGPATDAEFYDIWGVCTDGSGNIYIADGSNNRVRKVDVSGLVSTVAGNGTQGSSGDGYAATNAELYYPTGVACDASGNLYIADQKNNKIRMVNTSGIISTFAGNGSAAFSGDGGNATDASLNWPINVAIDPSGNLLIVDFYNSAIRKVTSGTISTIAGHGGTYYDERYESLGDGGAATLAYLYNPTSVACDALGNIYIDDENDMRIRKIDASGTITTVAWNDVGDGYNGDGQPATDAELHEAYGVAVDPCGNLFISDRDDYRIRVVNTSGYIYTYAGNGTEGNTGDGGPATDAEMGLTYSICMDPNGDLLIADGEYNVIRKVYQVCPGGAEGEGYVRQSNPNQSIPKMTGSIACFPNPNSGTFTLSGAIPNSKSQAVTIEIMDVLGNSIVSDVVPIENGGISKQIALGSGIANGVYLVKIKNETVNTIIRFTVSR